MNDSILIDTKCPDCESNVVQYVEANGQDGDYKLVDECTGCGTTWS